MGSLTLPQHRVPASPSPLCRSLSMVLALPLGPLRPSGCGPSSRRGAVCGRSDTRSALRRGRFTWVSHLRGLVTGGGAAEDSRRGPARPGKGPLGCGRAGPGCGSPAQACSAMLGTLRRSGHLSRRASWGTRVGSPQGPAAFCPPESPGDSAPGEGGRARRPSCVDRPRGPTASRAGHTDPAAALGQR